MDQFKWTVIMNRLRKMIDTSCPVIFAGNWEAEFKRGWRHVMNLHLPSDGNDVIIEGYQVAHGPKNVTVGQPFMEGESKPTPVPTFCGLYVRDVHDLVKEARAQLEHGTFPEEWAN